MKRKCSERTKKKLSAMLKGRKVSPEVLIERTRARWKKYPNWHSEDGIRRLKELATGRMTSQETKDKLSIAVKASMGGLVGKAKMVWDRRNFRHTEETKEKIGYLSKISWEKRKRTKIKAEQEALDKLSKEEERTENEEKDSKAPERH